MRSQFGPTLHRPLLRAPSGQGAGENKFAGGERAFRRARGQREGAQELRRAGARGKLKVAFDDVFGAGLDFARIEQRGGAFADALAIEAGELSRA